MEEYTGEEFQDMMARRKQRGKYRSTKTRYNGRTYDSKAEALYAQHLDIRRLAGEVAFWIPQPIFYLGIPENKYTADFQVFESAGKCWTPSEETESVPTFIVRAVDVKGCETKAFRKNVKLWAEYGPCELCIVKPRKGFQGWDVQEIEGGGKISGIPGDFGVG